MLLLGFVFVRMVDGAASSGDSISVATENLFHPLREGDGQLPRVGARDSRLVVNTWTGDFSSATARAWEVLTSEDSDVLLDAVEQVHVGVDTLPPSVATCSVQRVHACRTTAVAALDLFIVKLRSFV